MRLLALRGENLASLPRFAIDLESDPLAHAGLFAITGETGAGKSTMLDALCLAFYGDYPRAAVTRREGAPDPSGETIAVKDARNILRRGASMCFAEVDFIGRDGQRYRARWEVRRARGLANGKLQKIDRRLDRIADGAVVESIATGVSDVLDAVVQHTGLTFDQFRRTALLAQGEFDAFLLADESARAELLEKITGTEIYGRLSIAIHEATADRRHEIASREAAQGAVTLLDEAERTVLTAAIASADATVRDLGDERGTRATALGRARRQREARTHLVDAEQALAAAHAADIQVVGDRTRLSLLDRLAPVGAKAEAMRSAERTLADAVLVRNDADKRANDAAMASAVATVAWQKAMAADMQAARSYDSFEPLWREADQLDKQLTTAAQELADAESLSVRSVGDAEIGARALADLDAEIVKTRAERDAVARENEANMRHGHLAQRTNEIASELERFRTLSKSVVDATGLVNDAGGDMQRIAAQVAAAEKIVTEATAQRDAVGRTLEERRNAGRADDLHAVEIQDRALTDVRSMLREAESTARAWREAENNIVVARETAMRAREALADAEDRQQISEGDHGKQDAVRRELAMLHDLAEATASEAAELLRTTLVAAEPCPVCGSIEHPFMIDGQGAAERLVAEIRARRNALDEEIGDLSYSVAEARGDAAEARARAEEATRQANIATEEKARLAAHYASLVKPLAAALGASRLPHLLPAAVDVRTAHAIAQIAADAERARGVFAGQLTRVRDVRAGIDKLQTDYDAAQRRREDAMRQMDMLGLERRDVERTLSAADSVLRQHQAVLAVVKRALEPSLVAADLSLDALERDPDTVSERLAYLAKSFSSRQSLRKALDAKVQDLVVKAASAKATQKATLEAAERTKGVVAQRRADVERNTASRARLFNGVDSVGHRAALTAERDAKAAARATAIAIQQDKALAHAAAIERAEANREAVRQAELRVAEARLALAAAVGALGLPEPEALAMLAMPQSEIDALRTRLEAIARTLVEATRTQALRRADLTGLLGVGDGDIVLDEADSEQKLVELEAAIAAARDSTAAARARLSLDAAGREKVGALADEIQAAKTELDSWLAVDTAIGSAGGDKFRRFAQGITLDQLVRLANVQLDALDPRYRLARSQSGDLGLHVVDRDMGEETRSVRSLSGGERFLVSLALALALSGLEGRQSFVDTLFIDEGFGSLDAETLDMAIDALETLYSQGRKVGVITHVSAMIERIPVQIRVEKRGQGRSTVRVLSRDGAAVDKAA